VGEAYASLGVGECDFGLLPRGTFLYDDALAGQRNVLLNFSYIINNSYILASGQAREKLLHSVDVLFALVKLECIEQSVGRVLGVANDEEDKVDAAEVSQFNKPEEIPECCVVFVLPTAVIVDDIKL
jgi:hypothetical protein